MSPLEVLGLVLGTSFAAGLNLYATVLTAGLAQRLGWIALPGGLDVLADPLVLGIAGVLFVVEFLADKVPLVDSAWDLAHMLVRPVAAGVLALGAAGDLPASWQVAAALLAGGVALTSHGAKASTRAAVNASPEPVSNVALSLGEDMLAVGLTWLAVEHPVPAAVVAVVLVVLAVVVIRAFWRLVRRVAGRGRQGAAS